jgi:hypothetical protein
MSKDTLLQRMLNENNMYLITEIVDDKDYSGTANISMDTTPL